ncbi:PrsW family intramembrane metalloprotease [Sinomonas sp. ASV486]|uniref:PrsW family intramembrane metalloprotease n=1 Tax=Sinomonas sp. ASV486 TaxID=3051170 RepID=UPI0027DDCE1C|nr:PrsW family intramembrane metalloprotease [Sinomonas sp. ASV486]MDQ4491470.1 PrsW family intramembrane metalloprotease [Sinomonas sp. ASV486]
MTTGKPRWERPGPGQRPPQQELLVPVPPRRRTDVRAGLLAVLVAGTGLLIAGLAVVVPFLVRATGSAGFLVGFLLSLFPLVVVLLAVHLVDRWEPEPRRLLAFALAWGAVMAVAATTLIQPLFMGVFGPRAASAAQTAEFLATIEAPVVEELSKGLGLLILMFAARKYIDGPVDGIVYGMTIAAGFAFTENILYFGRLYAETSGSAASLAVVFTMRGVLSPFAHAMFTGTLGLVTGLAARRWSPGLVLGAFAVGLLPAMLLHNIWNSAGEDFFLLYVIVQLPLFGAAVLGVYLLRRSEARLTHRRLVEYAQAGWFTPLEVDMLATPRGRRAGLRWAASLGRRKAMRSFIRTATELAATRQRVLSGRDVRGYAATERGLLDRSRRERAAVLGIPPTGPQL